MYYTDLCRIVKLECHVITAEYRTHVHCIHLFCNALVHVIYSGVSGQCSHTISDMHFISLTLPLNRETFISLLYICTSYAASIIN